MQVENTLSWPLEHAARLHGDRLATLGGPEPVTYRELKRRVGGLGAGLERLGLQRGSVAAVLAENSRRHLECWLGVPAHGRVLNDLNIRLATAELTYMLTHSEARALFVDAALLESARELRERCEHLEHLVYLGDGPCPEDCEPYEQLVALDPAPAPELDGDDLAAISYTGGTTGVPKGVMLSHANLIANAKHNAMVNDYREDDVYLHSAPMFHVADACPTLAVTWAGGTHAFLPRFDAAAVSAAIVEHGVTILVMVPTMIRTWLAELTANPIDLRGVRFMVYAGSPISTNLQLEAIERFPFELFQGYGMTETAPSLTYLTGEDHRLGAAGGEPYRTRLGSVGRPLRGVQVEIRDGDGSEVAPGEIGEVWARGPNVMLGYWRQPEATSHALVDGWYRTGDAGRSDDDGYVYLVDRIKDMIVTGGENVYSVEVEQVLLRHDAVLEAAVFGVPDARWGEAVTAVVVVAEGEQLDAESLIEHCRGHIAGYKVPRAIEVRTDPLPKTSVGKILKNELRAPYWEGAERLISGS
jgi:long-chain acyl-CoA synthetase